MPKRPFSLQKGSNLYYYFVLKGSVSEATKGSSGALVAKRPVYFKKGSNMDYDFVLTGSASENQKLLLWGNETEMDKTNAPLRQSPNLFLNSPPRMGFISRFC